METLADRIARNGAINELDAVGWAIRLAKRLEALHAMGVAHGSISPTCMLTAGPERNARALMIDVRRTSSSLAFHSPERVTGGSVSMADDAWALAVTLYMALTGSPPFAGTNDADTKQKILAATPAPLAVFDVGDDDLQHIVDAAFARELPKRTSAVAALRRALEEWHPDANVKALPALDDEDEHTDNGTIKSEDHDADEEDNEATVMKQSPAALQAFFKNNAAPSARAATAPNPAARPERITASSTSTAKKDDEDDDEVKTVMREVPQALQALLRPRAESRGDPAPPTSRGIGPAADTPVPPPEPAGFGAAPIHRAPRPEARPQAPEFPARAPAGPTPVVPPPGDFGAAPAARPMASAGVPSVVDDEDSDDGQRTVMRQPIDDEPSDDGVRTIMREAPALAAMGNWKGPPPAPPAPQPAAAAVAPPPQTERRPQPPAPPPRPQAPAVTAAMPAQPAPRAAAPPMGPPLGFASPAAVNNPEPAPTMALPAVDPTGFGPPVHDGGFAGQAGSRPQAPAAAPAPTDPKNTSASWPRPAAHTAPMAEGFAATVMAPDGFGAEQQRPQAGVGAPTPMMGTSPLLGYATQIAPAAAAANAADAVFGQQPAPQAPAQAPDQAAAIQPHVAPYPTPEPFQAAAPPSQAEIEVPQSSNTGLKMFVAALLALLIAAAITFAFLRYRMMLGG